MTSYSFIVLLLSFQFLSHFKLASSSSLELETDPLLVSLSTEKPSYFYLNNQNNTLLWRYPPGSLGSGLLLHYKYTYHYRFTLADANNSTLPSPLIIFTVDGYRTEQYLNLHNNLYYSISMQFQVQKRQQMLPSSSNHWSSEVYCNVTTVTVKDAAEDLPMKLPPSSSISPNRYNKNHLTNFATLIDCQVPSTWEKIVMYVMYVLALPSVVIVITYLLIVCCLYRYCCRCYKRFRQRYQSFKERRQQFRLQIQCNIVGTMRYVEPLPEMNTELSTISEAVTQQQQSTETGSAEMSTNSQTTTTVNDGYTTIDELYNAFNK